jgi:3'-phosphoadenosine 5'-phosphosulfate sulfotransferase (PAPS reductase)/FAD synthetase
MSPTKQRADEALWWQAWQDAATYPAERLDRLVDDAVERIRRADRPGLAWSGGKDSIALAWLYDRAIGDNPWNRRGCAVLTAELEYPAFEAWQLEHLPNGVDVVRTPQTWDWLARNPGWLFPRDSRGSSAWFAAVQHAGQDRWQRAHGGTLVLGRRADDGNRVPKAGHDVKRGVGPRLYPIRDWPREAALALIRREGLPLPPIYRWPRGWRTGTGPWAKRRAPADAARPGRSRHQFLWDELDQIDGSIRARARAHGLPGA